MGDLPDGTDDRPARSPDSRTRLMDALRETIGAADPVPPHVTDGIRAAFSLREFRVLSADVGRDADMGRVSGALRPGGRDQRDGPGPRWGERDHPYG
jgi:hypothetical protein